MKDRTGNQIGVALPTPQRMFRRVQRVWCVGLFLDIVRFPDGVL